MARRPLRWHLLLTAGLIFSATGQQLDFLYCHAPTQTQNLGMYSAPFEELAFAYAGEHGFSASPAQRTHRDVSRRSAECACSFSVNVAAEHYRAVFRPHVHAYGVRFT
jgi:hypothetical protein